MVLFHCFTRAPTLHLLEDRGCKGPLVDLRGELWVPNEAVNAFGSPNRRRDKNTHKVSGMDSLQASIDPPGLDLILRRATLQEVTLVLFPIFGLRRTTR